MENDAAAKVRLDIATATLAAQSLGKGKGESEKKAQEPASDSQEDTGKGEEAIGISQFLASVAE